LDLPVIAIKANLQENEQQLGYGLLYHVAIGWEESFKIVNLVSKNDLGNTIQLLA
jgi:hypothetical protein